MRFFAFVWLALNAWYLASLTTCVVLMLRNRTDMTAIRERLRVIEGRIQSGTLKSTDGVTAES